MKTALQELIEWSQKDFEIFIEDTDEALRIFKAIKDKATELLEKEGEQNHCKLDNVFELGASAFQDCLNPHTLEFDHETYKRLKEEAVNQNK